MIATGTSLIAIGQPGWSGIGKLGTCHSGRALYHLFFFANFRRCALEEVVSSSGSDSVAGTAIEWPLGDTSRLMGIPVAAIAVVRMGDGRGYRKKEEVRQSILMV